MDEETKNLMNEILKTFGLNDEFTSFQENISKKQNLTEVMSSPEFTKDIKSMISKMMEKLQNNPDVLKEFSSKILENPENNVLGDNVLSEEFMNLLHNPGNGNQ